MFFDLPPELPIGHCDTTCDRIELLLQDRKGSANDMVFCQRLPDITNSGN